MHVLRRFLAISVSLFATGLVAGGHAAAESLIGLAAPLSGPSAILGEQVRVGAAMAVAAEGETADARLETVDTACSPEGGTSAARQFVNSGVEVVIGFLCTESIEAALPILKDAAIPVITVGVRTDSLTDRRDRTGFPVYRLGPRADSESRAVGQLLTRLWSNEHFAIVDDGTIYGRELAESLRMTAEEAGLRPVFIDTFRPQLENQIGLVGRLRKAGAARVFVGGDRDDIAVMARDAAELDSGMVFAGGEALRAPDGDVALAEGTLMVAPVPWSARTDSEVLAAFQEEEVAPLGYALPAYAAVEVALAALAAAEPGRGLPSLSGRDFPTAVGTIRFDEKGDLDENLYGVFRYDGAVFVPVEQP